MKSTKPSDHVPDWYWIDEPLELSPLLAKLMDGKIEGKYIAVPTRMINFRKWY
jgi:hypothetical protein